MSEVLPWYHIAFSVRVDTPGKWDLEYWDENLRWLERGKRKGDTAAYLVQMVNKPN